jgi:citrate synthase
MATWLTSQEAAKRLGVSRPTLYAYVSRGLVHSTPSPDHPHARRYAREDIERLCQRDEQRRHPEKVMGRALHWGMPLLESSITLVAGNRLYYRGYDASVGLVMQWNNMRGMK